MDLGLNQVFSLHAHKEVRVLAQGEAASQLPERQAV
jgi:hypothetical protein